MLVSWMQVRFLGQNCCGSEHEKLLKTCTHTFSLFSPAICPHFHINQTTASYNTRVKTHTHTHPSHSPQRRTHASPPVRTYTHAIPPPPYCMPPSPPRCCGRCLSSRPARGRRSSPPRSTRASTAWGARCRPLTTSAAPWYSSCSRGPTCCCSCARAARLAPKINQSINQSIHPSINQSINHSY